MAGYMYIYLSLALVSSFRNTLSQNVSDTDISILFGRCSTLVPQSMCYNLLGEDVSILYPVRRSVTLNTSLSDYDVLQLYENRIRNELESYNSSGINLSSERCRRSVLLVTCLEFYGTCSPSEPRDDCRFPCDKWRAHVAGNCKCGGGSRCSPTLEKIFNSCPLEEGPTVKISRRKSQCQTLPEDVQHEIINTTPSDELDCGLLPESSFCHPVLQSFHVVTTTTHNLLDRVAQERYNSTTRPLGIPYLNLTSELCETALRLFLCMATYTPCSTSRGSNTVHSQYCGEINATTIFKKILDTCECTISGNCRQRIFAAVDGDLNFPVQSGEQSNTSCLFLPDGIRRLFVNITVTPTVDDGCHCPPFEDNSSPRSYGSSLVVVIVVCVIGMLSTILL